MSSTMRRVSILPIGVVLEDGMHVFSYAARTAAENAARRERSAVAL